MEEEDPRRAS